MSASDYKVQIVHIGSGTVVSEWAPREGYETVSDEIALRAVAKGIGIGKTAKHGFADVKAAVQEFLLDLHNRV